MRPTPRRSRLSTRCGAQIGSPGCHARSENVLCACGPHARAGHYFVTYDPHSDAIHLDYSLLECPDLSRSGGVIGGLRQTFVRRAGRYVLSRSQRDVRPKATGILAGFGRGMRLGIFWLEHEQEQDWKPGSQRPGGGRVGGFHANTDGWIYACPEITLNRQLPEGLFRCRPGSVETRACSDSNRGCQPLRSLHAVTFEVGGRARNCFQLNR